MTTEPSAMTPGVVRASWFKAYVEGNAFVPQHVDILAMTVFEAVLRDPPTTWEELGSARLDDEQLRALGKYMTFLHRAKGINIPDQRHAVPNQESVADARLQELWVQSVDLIYLIVLSYINSIRGRSQDHRDLNIRNLFQREDREVDSFFNDPRNNREIDGFFADPQDAEPVRKLTAIIKATRDGFFSRRGRRLAAVYRSTFLVSSSREIRASSAKLRDEISRIHSAYPGGNARAAALKEFSAYARSVALERVPEFKGNAWYAELPGFETLLRILQSLPRASSGSSAAP